MSLAPPTPTPARAKSQQCRFSEADDLVLAQMLFEDKLTSTTNGGPKAAVFTSIANVCNTRIGMQGTPKTNTSVRHRKDRLQHHYWSPIHNMLKTSGFGWDEGRKCVTATEDVWAMYLEAKPKALQWKNKSWPLYDEFDKVWGQSLPTGLHVRKPGDASSEDEAQGNIQVAASDEEDIEEVADEEFFASQTPLSQTQRSSSSSLPPPNASGLGSSVPRSRKRSSNIQSLLKDALGGYSIGDSVSRLDRLLVRGLPDSPRTKRSREAIEYVKGLGFEGRERARVVNKLLHSHAAVNLVLEEEDEELKRDLINEWAGSWD